MSDNIPLVDNPHGWGSIKDVVNAPLDVVTNDSSWISVIGMWLTLPFNLLIGVFSGLCSRMFVCLNVGTCCIPGSTKCCSTLGSVLAGHPLYMAWTWWLWGVAALTALATHTGRLGLFLWEWAAFGSGRYFWHGEGVWVHTYEDCDTILRSNQPRTRAFGCFEACSPDLFASNLLIFLPNNGPSSEWGALRSVVHEFFLNVDSATYKKRLVALKEQVASDWTNPEITDLSKVPLLQKTVVKCVFYVMFGVWLEDAEATELTQWRKLALFFILPRLPQRFLFNYGINQVKALREKTVGIVEKYGKQEVFVDMNQKLPQAFRRDPIVKLCDEIMYVVGFAGIGGTSAAVEAVGAFLQSKLPSESPGPKFVKFARYDTSEKMVEKYKENPEKYIRETCRMVPPVTSATSALTADTPVFLAGREFALPKGTLQQYAVSMANRDEALFKDPSDFDPDRMNLNKAITWNGAFGDPADEGAYPRICPGRYLSLDITRIIVNHAISHVDVSHLHAAGITGKGCCA